MQGWAVPEATWKDSLVSERQSLSRSAGAALEGASGAVISFVFPGTPLQGAPLLGLLVAPLLSYGSTFGAHAGGSEWSFPRAEATDALTVSSM